MKRILALLLVFVLMPAACAREYPVRGPGGGIAMTVTLPEGFNPATDRCPMVILMHGIFSDHARTARAIQSRSSEGRMGLGLMIRTEASSFIVKLAKTVFS